MALDKQETSNSLFGNIKKATKQPPKEVIPASLGGLEVKSELVAPTNEEWEFIERITLPLSVEQKEGVDRIAKNIMRNRSKSPFNKEKRERITANTIIRVLIDNLLEKEELLAGAAVNTEEEARLWVKRVFKD